MKLAPRIVAPISGAFTLLLPKCPLCVLALLQLAGIHSVFVAGLVSPVFLALAGIPAVLLAIQAVQLRSWTPFGMYVSGAALLILGRLYWGNAYASGGGVVLLAAAAIWTARCRASSSSCKARCARLHTEPRPSGSGLFARQIRVPQRFRIAGQVRRPTAPDEEGISQAI